MRRTRCLELPSTTKNKIIKSTYIYNEVLFRLNTRLMFSVVLYEVDTIDSTRPFIT